MFHLSKLAPSSEQTPGLEERKNEDITPPRGKMDTREESKTTALQVMAGHTVRFPQTPCYPFQWTHFEYLGGPLTCFHSGGQHGFSSVFMLSSKMEI